MAKPLEEPVMSSTMVLRIAQTVSYIPHSIFECERLAAGTQTPMECGGLPPCRTQALLPNPQVRLAAHFFASRSPRSLAAANSNWKSGGKPHSNGILLLNNCAPGATTHAQSHITDSGRSISRPQYSPRGRKVLAGSGHEDSTSDRGWRGRISGNGRRSGDSAARRARNA
jgi:hypothetical protein